MKMGMIVAVLLLAACDNSPLHTPVPGTNCYYQEIACRGGGCCPQGSECGGVWPNCPKDSCCAVGGEGRLFGKKRIGAADAGVYAP